MKLTTDRHEASRGLFATAELLIVYRDRRLNKVVDLILTSSAVFLLNDVVNEYYYFKSL